MSDSVSHAFESGVPEPIIDAARQLGKLYREALNTIARMRRANVAADCKALRAELTHAYDDFFTEIDGFVPEVRSQIAEGLARPEPTVRVLFTFTFRVTNMPRIRELILQLKAKRKAESA
ncbi:MAG: hypothetical protein JOZ54_11660 [Acidobacteria bacterium]|nr:hypothetical protein [Acidobacteriota bacterium]